MGIAPKINGTSIKEPTDFDVEKYKLSKSGRVASGKMTMEIIAKKKKFNFSYAVLSGTELETITDILDSNTAFYNFSFVENGDTKTYTIYPGAIKFKKFRTDGVWYWKDVQFSLIEQ